EDAAAVGPHDPGRAARGDRDGDVAHRDARERPPAAEVGEPIRGRRPRRAEHDPTEHADPSGTPVADVRDDRRDEPAASPAALPEAPDRILDAGPDVHGAACLRPDDLGRRRTAHQPSVAWDLGPAFSEDPRGTL